MSLIQRREYVALKSRKSELLLSEIIFRKKRIATFIKRKFKKSEINMFKMDV